MLPTGLAAPVRERREGGEAGGVGDLELEAAARGRRVRGIGVSQVLDQRLDPLRRRTGVEGDGERAAGAAGEAADEARDRQRAAVEVVVGVGEGDVRGDDLRRAVDRVLEEGDRRGEAGQRRNRVRHGSDFSSDCERAKAAG